MSTPTLIDTCLDKLETVHDLLDQVYLSARKSTSTQDQVTLLMCIRKACDIKDDLNNIRNFKNGL